MTRSVGHLKTKHLSLHRLHHHHQSVFFLIRSRESFLIRETFSSGGHSYANSETSFSLLILETVSRPIRFRYIVFHVFLSVKLLIFMAKKSKTIPLPSRAECVGQFVTCSIFSS